MVAGKALDTREFPGVADAAQTVRRGVGIMPALRPAQKPEKDSREPESSSSCEQHGANMANCARRIQSFGANVDAVLNTVAAKHAKRVVKT